MMTYGSLFTKKMPLLFSIALSAFSLSVSAQDIQRIPEITQTEAISGASNFAQAMDNSMNIMNAGMSQAPMNGDPDHDFASMMIPHHQGAVNMAKAELLFGKNPVLRRLAQEIIVTQNSEISVMQSELGVASAETPPHNASTHKE